MRFLVDNALSPTLAVLLSKPATTRFTCVPSVFNTPKMSRFSTELRLTTAS